MSKIVTSINSGLRMAGVTLVIASILAFMAAPTFLGVVFITASVVMTVYMYTAVAFVFGVLFKWFFGKEDEMKHES